jgi:2-polyprenyl-3-methyl-5-hydroxy-6-metoxy-1,4-benzoquinol methylase
VPVAAACCPLCGSPPGKIVERAESPYCVVKCSDCGLAYVDPIPDAKELARHYNEDYYTDWLNDQRASRERMWNRRLSRIESLSDRGRLLDVGCGEGLFLEVAQQGGWRVSGTDISAYATEFASKRLGQDCFCGEIWDAPFDERSFDVITLWHVLEHSSSPISTMQAVYNLLKHKGLLVLAVPNLNDRLMQTIYWLLKGRRQRLFALNAKEIHLLHFTVRSLKALLAKTGFICLQVMPDYGVVQYSKKLINVLAAVPFYFWGVHWYNSIQVIARRN